ncbi:hypothetical protein HYS94_04070 [Candidatus Daviesbacteria bacterium]|nr:hypothetical protein [Candidatus Daviesbacteria bacterium]
MSLKTFLTIASASAIVFGVPLIFFPQMMAANFGISLDSSGEVFAKTAGAMLVTLGLINWLARNWKDTKALKDLLLADILVQLLTLVIDFMSINSGAMNQMGWIGVILHIVLAAGLLYFYRKL